ncbi:hypothetical protein O181_130386, partial [Austropuccinia psidii MF-1]|nr:hypothetical protein [Austropuccinia psidii MF-1]
SRQRQLSHVSHENVTQSPNPFQHYSQFLGNFTSLACASPPNPPRRFACLRARTALQMRLQHSSTLLTLSHPALTIFMLTWCTPDMLPTPLILMLVALPTCSRHCLSLRSRSALPTCSRHHLSLRLCSALLTLLTILMLAACPPSTAYHPYARRVPSRHHLSLRLWSASQHAPNTLILTLPYYIHSVRWLVGVHNERNRRNMLSGLLCQQDLRGNWSVYSQCCG